MSTFPSFDEIHKNFTILPNSLLDCLVDERLDTYDRNILLFIARQTYGWRCAFDHLTMADFAKTGISKTKALECLKKLEQLNYILVSRILDAKKQQHKIYFVNTNEAQRLLEFCKSGEMSYKELARYRQMQIAAKKEHGTSGELPPYAENTGHVRDAYPPRSCGEPLLKESLKANIKKQQQSIPQTPFMGSDAPAVEKPAAAFFENAAPEPEPENQGDDLTVDWDALEQLSLESELNQATQEIPLLANPSGALQQPGPDNAPEPPPVATTPPAPDLEAKLVAAQVDPDAARELARKYPEQCQAQLDYLPYRATVARPGAYLAAAIRGSYAPPADYVAPAEQQEDTARKDAAAEVLAKVKPGMAFLNSNGEKCVVLSVRQNGVTEVRNLDRKMVNNVFPERILTWGAAV